MLFGILLVSTNMVWTPLQGVLSEDMGASQYLLQKRVKCLSEHGFDNIFKLDTPQNRSGPVRKQRWASSLHAVTEDSFAQHTPQASGRQKEDVFGAAWRSFHTIACFQWTTRTKIRTHTRVSSLQMAVLQTQRQLFGDALCCELQSTTQCVAHFLKQNRGADGALQAWFVAA